MKKNDLTDIKALEIKTLRDRAKKVKSEIADLILDKNMSKLKDLKSISKKRKDLAQVLTVLRQKELLEELEGGSKKEEKMEKTEEKMTKTAKKQIKQEGVSA